MPACGRRSRAIHSRYVRRPAELPRLGQPVGLEVHVRRLFCRDVACTRRTFAEPWTFLAPHARRTIRLASAQRTVATAVSAETGARVLARLAMPMSPDTLLRLVRRAPLPVPTTRSMVPGISWVLGLARGTVRKYAYAASFPERAARAPEPSLLDPYLPHLVARHRAGCTNGHALWREILAMG